MKQILYINQKRCVISFSFGNYLKADGGTDKVIAEHQKIFNANGISYLQISPILYKANHYKMNNDSFFYAIVLDGVYMGIATEDEIYYLVQVNSEIGVDFFAVFIHHFSKFKNSFWNRFFEGNKTIPINIYLHDYYTVCPQLNLLRNNLTFCGLGEKNHKACSGCIYANVIDEHQSHFAEFIRNYSSQITIIAPSQIVLNIWKSSYNKFKLDVPTIVIPHQSFEGINYKLPDSENGVSIAFVGRYINEKGKDAWEKLALYIRAKNLPFKLFYLGFSEEEVPNTTKLYVKVDANNPNAMQETLVRNDINVVFLWSECAETYSYAYYEAYSANTYIITNNISGNISDAVSINKNGIILSSVEELLKYISSGKFKKDYFRFCEEENYGPKILVPNKEILNYISNEHHRFSFCTTKNKYPKQTVMGGLFEFLYRIKNGF